MIKKNFIRSVSSETSYPDFCLNAFLNSDIFNNFRKNPVYCQILEHVSKEQGELYIDEISKRNAILMNSIGLFKENDSVGNPQKENYSEIGYISPSTLRYIKVLSDLLIQFHCLDNLSICEIGVGYGGQCRIIDSYCSIANYTLVDLKPVLMLSQRYLDNYLINSTLIFKTMNELDKKIYDLVISNYAFTELSRAVQDIYLNKVILNSKKGYITYNDINPSEYGSYKKDELIELIPGSFIIEEKPLTHPKNCIIIWSN